MGEPLIDSGEPTKRVTIRVPKSLKDDVDELAEQQNRSRSPVIRDALRRYVEVETGEIPDFGPQDDLQKAVNRLTHQLKKQQQRDSY